jgi:hypothetical protein
MKERRATITSSQHMNNMKHQSTIIDSIVIVVIFGILLLFPEVEEVHSFLITTPTRTIRKKVVVDDYYSSSQQHHPSALFLHVESLHPHRDSLLTLTDPIVLPPDDDDDEKNEASSSNNNINIINNSNHVEGINNQDEEKHKSFFADKRHRIAPIALLLYAFGNYLSTHTHPVVISGDAINDGGSVGLGMLPSGSGSSSFIDVDPMLLGGALIAIGLLTVTWTMDEIIHVVRQYMNDNRKDDE